MNLVAIMEAGRRDFLDAIREVSPEQASFKPAPDRWSVLECVEHVVTVEDRHLGWLSNGTADAGQRNSEKEMRLFTTIRSRLTKVESPEAVRPQGRFGTLAAALAAFEAVRDRTVAVIQKSGDGLYSMGAKHPYFGKVNGAELIQLIDGHARRHADQIRENCELFSTAQSFAGAGEAITIRGDQLQDVEWPNLRTPALTVENSVLERVQLAGAQLGTVLWQDARLVGCDLANVRADRLVLARVELIDCRLTGMSASDADWQDVTIQSSDRALLAASGWNVSELRIQRLQLAGRGSAECRPEGRCFPFLQSCAGGSPGSEARRRRFSHLRDGGPDCGRQRHARRDCGSGPGNNPRSHARFADQVEQSWRFLDARSC